jgi:hypothetical protein
VLGRRSWPSGEDSRSIKPLKTKACAYIHPPPNALRLGLSEVVSTPLRSSNDPTRSTTFSLSISHPPSAFQSCQPLITPSYAPFLSSYHDPHPRFEPSIRISIPCPVIPCCIFFLQLRILASSLVSPTRIHSDFLFTLHAPIIRISFFHPCYGPVFMITPICALEGYSDPLFPSLAFSVPPLVLGIRSL